APDLGLHDHPPWPIPPADRSIRRLVGNLLEARHVRPHRRQGLGGVPCSLPFGNNLGNCLIQRAMYFAGFSSVFTSPFAATTARMPANVPALTSSAAFRWMGDEHPLRPMRRVAAHHGIFIV